MWTELAASLQHGNAYVIAMMVLGFFSLVIVFERWIMLQYVYHVDFDKFLNNLKKMVLSGDMDRAISLAKNTSHTSVPRIALRALEAAETDPTRVRGTIEEGTIEFLPRIERRLGLLPMFSTLIMLIGILGTIDGLWTAFHASDVLDTSRTQATISRAIASSLNPTAMGLFVCMIILAGHHLLKGFALRLIDNTHHGIAVLQNLIVPRELAAVPAGMAMAMPMQQQPAPAFTSAPDAPNPIAADAPTQMAAAAKEGAPAGDAFADASVEDIKDEEEII